MSDIKKEIESIFDSILSGMKQETEEEHGALIEMIKKNEKLLDSEMFHHLVLFKIKQIMECVLGGDVGPFFAYQIIEDNLYNFFNKYEGRAGCADKARTVAKSFVEYKKTGVLPIFERPDGCYWLPFHGGPDVWMSFCEGILQFVKGNPTRYIVGLKNVLEAYNEL